MLDQGLLKCFSGSWLDSESAIKEVRSFKAFFLKWSLGNAQANQFYIFYPLHMFTDKVATKLQNFIIQS